ncbi:hypothetical protein EC991_001003 [Linnemannia zychae]|nr:hypothetical protein EC991_001003 [Linnemannia zychae]
MPFSAKTALTEARPHIDAARHAQRTKDITKQYRDAKNILAKVDHTKEDIDSLKEMIGAFHELADILNNFGPTTQDKAEKCKKRAATLDQEANRETFVYHLPVPGEQFETTRQLAYCLALLQDSVDESFLDPDTLKWRRSTLESPDETIRMDTIARQVVTEFIDDSEKDATAVEEVVHLTQVLHKDSCRSLLMSLVNTVSNSKLLHLHSMEGLARVIQYAPPGSIDSDDLVTILQVLYTRLQNIHTPSINHLCHLLLALSRVLDAMVFAQVGDVDRVTLHGPLTALLHELESNKNPYVAFQAEYAIQALLNVSDNDTIWRLDSGEAAGFAKMPDPREIKDALEGLKELYEAGKGAAQMLNNTWVTYKTSENLTFNTKEGLKFKRIWYPTLRNAEEYIQTGDLQLSEKLRPSQSSLNDIQSALKAHYKPDLFIQRISGDELDLATCFVNLAIVESPEQRKKEEKKLKKQAHAFHRIQSFEEVEGSNIQSSIPLEQLFAKRKLYDGEENVPKRILVQGRAGIGKTTLCKKLVHAHQNGLWNDRFDAVLWIPLRQLRGTTSRTLESLLREKFFSTQKFDQEQEELARALTVRTDEGKTLLILDGFDEIASNAQVEGNSLMPLLRILLGQHHVLITTRPSGLNRLLLPQIDLELETVGFSQQNVKDFVVKVLDPGPARLVQDFIRRAPLIQGLVNIPLQLDVICFCWNSLPMDGSQVTMASLYQVMVRKLWCKDAIRLEKEGGCLVLTEQEVNDLSLRTLTN